MFEYLYDFLNLLFPDECVLCHFSLSRNEKQLCNRCFLKLPRVDEFSIKSNEIKNTFAGRINIDRAESFLVYSKRNPVQTLLQELKYNNNPTLAFFLGACFAQEKVNSGIFTGVDFLLAVPLHPKKQKERGYNQSEQIALGIQEITKIPYFPEVILKNQHTSTQTKKKRSDRQEAAKYGYQLNKAEGIAGKKILLIDDVLTTGATLEACATTLIGVAAGVSIATIAYSRKT